MPQILLHKGNTGVGGLCISMWKLISRIYRFQGRKKKNSNNTFEERAATGTTKIWKNENESLVNPRIPEENCSEVSCELAKT